MNKTEIINCFWNIYQKHGVNKAITWLKELNYSDENNENNIFYENYQNSLTTDNALNNLFFNMKI